MPTGDTIKSRITKIYTQAAKEIKAKLKDFEKKHKAKDAIMRKKVKAGEITDAQYKEWLAGQVFIGKQWKDKQDSIAQTLLYANQQANYIVNGERRAIFGEAATHQAYQLEKGIGADLSFGVYDSATVTKLVHERPELLPRKVVNGKKDRAWNKTKIANAVTQGIIQGESIPDIASRIAKDTASDNDAAMMRYARTAMTSAQNAGRMEVMHEAADMGIKVKKRWLATLDSRTRDLHAYLDGQEKDIDEDFVTEDGRKIGYPGDPSADPDLVYNCRCTLEYVYPDYKTVSGRRDNETKEVIPSLTYKEWKTAKEGGVYDDVKQKKATLDSLTNEVFYNKADKVFSGIWKDDVTYADWEDKKDRIDAKRQYFDSQIQRFDTIDPAKADEFRQKLADLNEFERNGAANYQLLKDREQALNDFKAAMPQPATPAQQAQFPPEAYSQARKNAALWAKTPQEVDNALRTKTGEVWRNATQLERESVYEYTQSYHKFNEPLRGIEYGTNRFLGVGNTDLDASYAHNGERLNAMTDIINKSTYSQDVWLQRGCGYGGMDKFFSCSEDLLRYGTQQELENELLGKAVTEYGFMSCGSMKGKGFSYNPIIMNVYAPSGTKMMYAEPFSAFSGGRAKLSWDGKGKQTNFGHELETILQQGTQLRVTKVERQGGGTIYIDLEVIDQSHQQRWKK